jgi:hypothetical protein
MDFTLHIPDSVACTTAHGLGQQHLAGIERVTWRRTIAAGHDRIESAWTLWIASSSNVGTRASTSRGAVYRSVVREFQDGQSPEAIRSAFPTLTLEQVYGAITFYLGHKEVVDRDVADRERTGDAFTETRQAPAELKDKLERARRKISSR